MANWRDIQDGAVRFAHRYAEAKDEDRDAKPFWIDLFTLYGIDPRSAGAFEERVRIHGRPGVGKIDYFSPKRFLIEHKSRGKNLDTAYKQAMDYFDSLKSEDKPRYVVISDFEHIHIYDLEKSVKGRHTVFLVKDLPKNVKKFAFLLDVEESEYIEEQAINVKAARAIGKLHRALKEAQYPINDLSPLLTRLVFCFFADDTGIFEQNSLRRYIETHTKEDGSDVGAHLATVFQVLNTPEDRRQNTTNDTLLSFPYVNGGLFSGNLATIFGNREVRNILLECIEFDWSNVSPAIFGSMFQSVMDEKERHDLGAHYTSEKNILKVIEPLFLDALQNELEVANNTEKLHALWDRIANITLLDPACGCGNFLVVAYRELRRIEIEIIKKLDKGKKGTVAKVDSGQDHLGLDIDLRNLSRMSVERMYGIEIEDFPAEVAKLSLWLVDHMMNMELGAYYGKPLKKLPLTEAPHILSGVSALKVDWDQLVSKKTLTHIIGNPPFIGSKVMSLDQRKEITDLFDKAKGSGVLDYVTGWYAKASEYIQGTSITCAFVSTNSITQGEQVGFLWRVLQDRWGINIFFAHRTFKWSNEASGKAAVYCVIIGFGQEDPTAKSIYVYDNVAGEPVRINAKSINPYLVDAPNILLESRTKPLSEVPEMGIGNKPIDGGYYLFTESEKELFLNHEPKAEKYFRKWVGSDEFLNGYERWCLWLGEASPNEIRSMPYVMARIESVREYREKSTSPQTRKLAETPTKFHVCNMPETSYLLIPETSSEKRTYIPIGFISPEIISSNAVKIVPNASLCHFGVLTSEMHMTWVRAVCGRLESRYRYSKDIVYNNFPWPENVSEVQRTKIESAAQGVLDIRSSFSESTLADLYDPLAMPESLLKAHKALDRTVESAYGIEKPFETEFLRIEFLFQAYLDLLSKHS